MEVGEEARRCMQTGREVRARAGEVNTEKWRHRCVQAGRVVRADKRGEGRGPGEEDDLAKGDIFTVDILVVEHCILPTPVTASPPRRGSPERLLLPLLKELIIRTRLLTQGQRGAVLDRGARGAGFDRRAKRGSAPP